MTIYAIFSGWAMCFLLPWGSCGKHCTSQSSVSQLHLATVWSHGPHQRTPRQWLGLNLRTWDTGRFFKDAHGQEVGKAPVEIVSMQHEGKNSMQGKGHWLILWDNGRVWGHQVSFDHPSSWSLKSLGREGRFVKTEIIMLKGGFEKGKITESVIISKAPKMLSQACWLGT